MARVRVFLSFDVDHDNDLKTRLVEEAATDGSLLAIVDWSIREVAADWDDKARKRISNVDLVLVICGEHTGAAAGVSNEIHIARGTNRPYLLIDGRPGHSTLPSSALASDCMLAWSAGLSRTPAATRRG